MLKNKKGMGAVSIVFIMMILCVFLTIGVGMEKGVEFERLETATNQAIDNASMSVNNITINFENPVINNSLTPFIKISIKYTMEMFRIGIRLALDVYEAYPEYINPEVLMTLFILFLVAPLIIPAVKLLIIIGILLNELRLKRKESKAKKKGKKIHNTIKKEAQQTNGKTK